MGGTVTVVIRESDGTEHRMQRWTNSLPWGITNAKMISENKDHINSYLKQWQEMAADWDANHATGKFEFFMTDCYFPRQGFAPVEYGFVLLDFKTKHLLSLQGYTGLDSVSGLSVMYDLKANNFDDDDGINETSLQRLVGLIKAGRITDIRAIDGSGIMQLPAEVIDDPSAKTIAKLLSGENKYKEFTVDWSPFTVIDYEFNKEGLGVKDAYLKVKELGFKLSEEEEGIWKQFIEDREEDGDE